MSANRSANSPLRSRTTGASSSRRVSAGKASVASTIWLTLWACRARPWFGQYGVAGPRIEQAQVVVDLGDRADGGARVVRGRLLLDRDRRREALDHVDIGLVHQLQELPGIRRQALDVAALALGIERIERQARLARARQAGDHDEAIPRDVEIDVLQVVGARAAHPDHGRADGVGGPGGRGFGKLESGHRCVKRRTDHDSGARISGARPALRPTGSRAA